MRICDNCESAIFVQSANFCPECGYPMKKIEKRRKWVGEDINKGIYRIVLPVVEQEFRNMDHLYDSLRHCEFLEQWGYIDTDKFKIIKVKSTVEKEEYPYICGKCKSAVIKEEDLDGYCEWCDVQEWVKR